MHADITSAFLYQMLLHMLKFAASFSVPVQVASTLNPEKKHLSVIAPHTHLD
jgi:hypothetical protein